MAGKIVDVLRPVAMKLPDVEEGIACKGTAIESSTFKTKKKKAFLFVGAGAVRLKLSASLKEAAALAKKEPDMFSVGAQSWVKISVADGDKPPLALLKRWIAESYDGAVAGAPAKNAAKKKKKARRRI